MKFKEKNSYNGFILKERKYIDSIECDVFYFEHEKTKAKLAAVKNDDTNKSFQISFKTLPSDSTGVAHILEHCVLSGSKKYPVKDVFGELIKGGLSTFMNAFTAPDTTSYPFATRNTKEFFNLLDVYLDTTLNPLLTKEAFKQEGWHYELLKSTDKVIYKGIVYNEMKGAMSDPIQQLIQRLKENLLKNTPYEYNSGGSPTDIPNLTYENFKKFHEKFYHPTNSVISLYGNGDLNDELAHINKFLDKFEYQKSDFSILEPEKINSNNIICYPYAVNSENIDDKVLVGQAYRVGDINDQELNFAFNLISELVFNSEASTLKNKVLESGLIRNFSSFFYDTLKHTALYLFFQGVKNSPEVGEKLRTIIREELVNIVKNGIDKDLIISEFNSLELIKSEELINANKFHIYLSATKYAMLENASIFDSLDMLSKIKELKDKVLNTSYLTDLIQKYLLDSDQFVTIQLQPDSMLSKQKEEEELSKLEKYQKSLSTPKIEELIEESKKLLEAQNKKNTVEEIAVIPKVSTKDVEPATFFKEVEEVESKRILFSEEATNNLVYFNLGFNIAKLPNKYLKYIDIFSEVLFSLGTKNMTFQKLTKEIYTWCGGFRTQLKFYIQNSDRKQIKHFFWLSTKFALENSPKVFDLLEDVLMNLDLSNRDKIKEIILKLYSHKESDYTSSGLSYVIKRLAYYEDLSGQLVEESSGFTQLKFLKDLVSNFEKKLPELLDALIYLNKFFIACFRGQDGLMIHTTSTKETYKNISAKINGFITKIENTSDDFIFDEVNTLEKRLYEKPKVTDEAFLTDADVVYVGKSVNIKNLGLQYHGSFEIALKFLKLDYLLHKVRVIGGAYGMIVNFLEKRGLVYLCSYRDPNIKETYEAYDSIDKALEKFKMTESDFDYLKLGSYASFNPMRSPFEKGEVARDSYLAGVKPNYYAKIIKEILSASQEQIRSYAPLFSKMANSGYKSIIGNKQKISTQKEHFKELVEL